MSLFLLDTRLLLWTAGGSARLSLWLREMLDDPGQGLAFSVASIWEVAVKDSLGKPNFRADPASLRRVLLDNDLQEFAIRAEHAIASARLPWLHRDPFDRILLAQADVEGAVLLTVDRQLAAYPCPVRLVS